MYLFWLADKNENKHSGQQRHGARNNKSRKVRELVNDVSNEEREDRADQTGSQPTQSGHGGDDVLREKVARKRQPHGGPAGITPGRKTNEQQREIDIVRQSGRNAGDDGQR